MAVDLKAPRPNVEQILAHSAYPETLWNLTPTQSGLLPVAAGRGGPINIKYEVHGHGPIKLVTAWQRQSLKYGHEQGDKYSSLVFDNRGMGGSDKPLMRYSTSEMAKDLIELLDHLGWTETRQLHVSGVSMGGMISQELGLMIPDRIATLNLISTAAAIENTTSFVDNLTKRIIMFMPKSLDQSLMDAARNMFPDSWLEAPDDAPIPKPGTPNVIFPASGKYQMFETNYHRFAAQELNKRLNTEAFQKKGFMLQAIAAGWHHMSSERLKLLGDKVGRDRIMVLHGTRDNMIPVIHGRKLIEQLKPGVSEIKEGSGHVFLLEATNWHNALVEKQIETASKLPK